MQPALMKRIAQELDPLAQAELAHRVGLVHLYGFRGDVQLPGDLLVAVSLRDPAQDFHFAVGDGGKASDGSLAFLRGKRGREVMREGWIDVLLTARSRPDSPEQIRVRALFQHIRRRPSTEQLLQKRLVCVSSQNYDGEIRSKLFQLASGHDSARCVLDEGRGFP